MLIDVFCDFERNLTVVSVDAAKTSQHLKQSTIFIRYLLKKNPM